MLPDKMQTLLTLLSLMNMFRLHNAQRLYVFIDGLQLYVYHQTDYTGIV